MIRNTQEPAWRRFAQSDGYAVVVGVVVVILLIAVFKFLNPVLP